MCSHVMTAFVLCSSELAFSWRYQQNDSRGTARRKRGRERGGKEKRKREKGQPLKLSFPFLLFLPPPPLSCTPHPLYPLLLTEDCRLVGTQKVMRIRHIQFKIPTERADYWCQTTCTGSGFSPKLDGVVENRSEGTKNHSEGTQIPLMWLRMTTKSACYLFDVVF